MRVIVRSGLIPDPRAARSRFKSALQPIPGQARWKMAAGSPVCGRAECADWSRGSGVRARAKSAVGKCQTTKLFSGRPLKTSNLTDPDLQGFWHLARAEAQVEEIR